MELTNVNFLAVGAAALASFGLGALWYTSILFGKAWQKELGFTDEYIQQGNMPKIFGTSFLLMLVMAFGMAMLIQGHSGEQVDMISGLYHGLAVGILFVGTSTGINMLYQRKSFKLWLIDAGYQIVFLGMQGLILGAWH